MEEATQSVTEQFATSKALKKAALTAAIGQIKGDEPCSAVDPVTNQFVQFFKAKGEEIKKSADGLRQVGELGAQVFPLADDLRSRLMRSGDDARSGPSIRHGPLRHRLPRLTTSGRCDDRRWHAHQQDGSGPPQGLRPDAGAALRLVDGQLCQRRRLLPLLLLSGAWLRSHRARGHLCARLSPDRRGTHLRPAAAPEEDQPRAQRRQLVPEEHLREPPLSSVAALSPVATP